MATGTCALCQAESKLCESHIISNFLYDFCGLHGDGAVREKFNMRGLSGGQAFHDGKRAQGIWEHLLCEKCEGRRNRIETKFPETIQGIRAAYKARRDKLGHPPFGELIKVSGLDYTNLRLFWYWTFWISSTSSREEFSAVKLLPTTQERLKRRLEQDDPGAPESDPIFVTCASTREPALAGLIDECGLPTGFIHPPYLAPSGLPTSFIGGFLWMLCPDELGKAFVDSLLFQPGGVLKVHVYSDDAANTSLVGDMKKMSGKLRHRTQLAAKADTAESGCSE